MYLHKLLTGIIIRCIDCIRIQAIGMSIFRSGHISEISTNRCNRIFCLRLDDIESSDPMYQARISSQSMARISSIYDSNRNLSMLTIGLDRIGRSDFSSSNRLHLRSDISCSCFKNNSLPYTLSISYYATGDSGLISVETR